MAFYGVWSGRKTGIFNTWDECSAQVNGFSGAKYRKLKANNLLDAEKEFNSENVVINKVDKPDETNTVTKKSFYTQSNSNNNNSYKNKIPLNSTPLTDYPVDGFLTVDGASNGQNCEYQAVFYKKDIKNYKLENKAFKSKTFNGGTNNIGEFLGLVHAIKYLKERNLPVNIYSDSVTAIAWVRDCKANTSALNTGKSTDELQSLIKEAEEYLLNHITELQDINICKWNTSSWGEIPADYGNK